MVESKFDVSREKFYDDIYKEKPSKWALEFRDEFAHKVISRNLTPKSVLDIGCGNGHTLNYFHQMWPDAELHGIDLSGEAVRLAQKNSPAHVVKGDFMDVTMPYVELAVAMGVAEHFLFLRDFLNKLKHSCDYAYIEAPNCLASSPIDVEGFRETHKGAGQAEWHLKRSTWEDYITDVGFDIIESVRGPSSVTRFVWLLKSPKNLVGHPEVDNFVPR